MDLLFIIDDSESMREEQENLSANLPGFIDILDNFNAGALDYRVGITTTGMNFALFTPPLQSTNLMGDNGELRQECGMTKRWYSSVQKCCDFYQKIEKHTTTNKPIIIWDFL